MERLGRYEILEELGRGAMGTVYRGRDPMIDRVVAIKTIRLPNLGGDEERTFRERFLREAQAAGKLSHSGIVTIYDIGEEHPAKTPYIVMEFVSGSSVEKVLREAQGGRLPPETALPLAQQVAEALDYAHAQGIVHRDIKPANILVTQEGHAKIADFGIAKLTASHMTMTGELLGTPSYMSPEQISGNPVDGRSDLFSLGVIVYLMLTGQKPFSGENLTEISFKIAYKDPVAPSQTHSGLSAGVDYLIERALAKDPGRRYSSGREFARDLDDLRQGREPGSRVAFAASVAEQTVITQAPAAIPAAAAIERTVAGAAAVEPRRAAAAIPEVSSGKKRWYAVAAALLLLLLLGGAGWWWFGGGGTRSPSTAGAPRAAARAGQQASSETSSSVPADNRASPIEEAGVVPPPGEESDEPSESEPPAVWDPPASSPSKSKEKGPPPWAPARGRRGR